MCRVEDDIFPLLLFLLTRTGCQREEEEKGFMTLPR